MDNSNEDRTDEYRNATRHLFDFGRMLESLIDDIVRELGVVPQNIASRVKDQASVERKLKLKGDRYSSVAELTDLLGIRVVTYLPDDVDIISNSLYDEFSIDLDNSVDKRVVLEPNQFGYSSVHFVAELRSDRARLTEYKRFAGRKFEIQLRSVLQHAWAEIEHDLGYKSNQGIPDLAKRHFSRLSALLEIADDEFQRLKAELSSYEEDAKERVTTNRATGLALDQATLTIAIGSHIDYIELDQRVARALGRDLQTEIDNRYVSSRVVALQAIGFTELDSLTNFIKSYGNYMAKFAELWASRPARINEEQVVGVPAGVCTFYAELVYRLYSDSPREAWIAEGATFNYSAARDKWEEVTEELGEVELRL